MEILTIYNDNFFNYPESNANNIIHTHNKQDCIDIYLYDDLIFSEEEGFGYANGIGESTELILGGYWVGDQVIPLSKLKVISHEMGHVLFLWHTHHGTDPDDNSYDPNACAELVNPVTDPNEDYEAYLEQVNNPHTCGDYIADTPADPNINTFANRYSCVYEGGGTDANGDTYQPDTGNLMSYTYPTCMTGFTNGQIKRMKNAYFYLPQLYNTHLDTYTYIRDLTNNNCFVCSGDNLFQIFSSYDLTNIDQENNNIIITSSDNIQTEIITSSGNSAMLNVTSLLDSNAVEGEPGYFSVVIDGNIVATQHIWVGKPQAVPDNVLTGNDFVSPNQSFTYGIGLENRLHGVDTYEWVFPEPNEEIDNYDYPDYTTWQHLAWDKYYTITNGLAGNQTGWVTVYGKNPCGLGSNGDNKICVQNSDDPEGDTECEDDDDPPPTIIYYPNPASSLLEVDLSLQDYKVFDIVIYDDSQNVRYSGQSTNVVKSIDASGLPDGNYYLHIYDGDEQIFNAILVINH